MAVIGRWAAPYSPNATDPKNWVQHVLVDGTGPGTSFPAQYYPLPFPPSAAHWLGTTVFAQDALSQVLASTQATLFVGLLAAAIATVLSILFGVTAGYIGGGTDEGLSLVANVFLAIPGLPLLIVLADYVPNAGSSIFLVGRHHRGHDLGLQRAHAASADAVAAQPRLRRSGQGVRRGAPAHHPGRGTAQPRPDRRGVVPVHDPVSDRRLRRDRVPRSRRVAHGGSPRPVELGRDAARGFRQQRGAQRLVVVVGAARASWSPCSALAWRC